MLVLSRQRDEIITIGDDVEVCVVDIRGDKVRLGITAPSDVPVHRKEVHDAIQRENAQSGGPPDPSDPSLVRRVQQGPLVGGIGRADEGPPPENTS